MKRNWITLGFLVGFGLSLLAQEPESVPPAFEKAPDADGGATAVDPFDPDARVPKMIQVQVEYIELSHESLTRLLFLAEPKSTDATPLRKQLQELVAKNEAKVLETQIVVCKSGQKATTESLHEFSYPTEYEPPSGGKPDEKPKDFTGGSSFPYIPATPTAFDTRNVGCNLDVEPTLSEDHKIIDVRLVPELLWHTGDKIWQEAKDTLGNVSNVKIPDFYVIRANTAVTCISGQYMLISVQSPKDAQGDTDMTRKVVVLLKCDVLSVK